MIIVRNNFLADPAAEREKALAAKYETIVHNGVTYRGMSEQPEGPECAEIRAILGFHRGKIVTGYRQYLAGQEDPSYTHTYIHADSNIGTYTAILFLNTPEQCRGGTAFWRYKPYNWHMLPTQAELAAQGIDDKPEMWDRLLAEGHEERHWQMHEYVHMCFNRLLIFDARLFHSRFPKQAFGSGVETGRLIKLFFMTPP